MNCSCVKNGRKCSTCLPSRHVHCVNAPSPPESSIEANTWDTEPPEAPVQATMRYTNIQATQTDSSYPIKEARSQRGSPLLRELPPPTPISTENFVWSEKMNGDDFTQAVSAAYEEVIHWRRNLFLTPSGHAGKQFVSKLARLFHAYGEGSSLEPITLKAAMIMPALILQKPHASSKARDHVICLQHRLISWQEGDIDNLMREGRTIQQHLRKTSSHMEDDQRLAHTFSKLMFQEKVQAALRLLSADGKGSSLPLDDNLKQTIYNCSQGTSQETSNWPTCTWSHPGSVQCAEPALILSC